jgi:hypothetical protein
MSTFAESREFVLQKGHDAPRSDFFPTERDMVSVLKTLAEKLTNDPFLNDTHPYWLEDKHIECKKNVAAICEGVELLQRRIGQMECEFREKERLMVESYEMQVWRVTEGLPRYDTWGKPPVKVFADDDPIVYPVPLEPSE